MRSPAAGAQHARAQATRGCDAAGDGATIPVARRGRPRDAALDAAILEATLDELAEHGFAGLAMEVIAARAGVAKTTLYRRWPNTSELALDALRTYVADVSEPPGGTLREQLVWLTDVVREAWNEPRYAAIMRRVSADGTSAPQLYRHYRDRLIGPHRRRILLTLRRGVDDGLLRADTDIGWAARLLLAPVTTAALTHNARVSRAQLEATVDIVLRGLAP